MLQVQTRMNFTISLQKLLIRFLDDNATLEQVSHFTNLGAVYPLMEHLVYESRIGKAAGAFNSLSRVWRNHNIPTKIRIYRAAVLTLLLCGSKTWATIKNHDHRVQVYYQ